MAGGIKPYLNDIVVMPGNTGDVKQVVCIPAS